MIGTNACGTSCLEMASLPSPLMTWIIDCQPAGRQMFMWRSGLDQTGTHGQYGQWNAKRWIAITIKTHHHPFAV